MKKFITALLLTVICAICKGQTGQIDGIAELQKDDPVFLALKDTAQKHMPQFISELSKNNPGFKFVIKSDFTHGDEHEHMWSLVIDFKIDKFNCMFIDSAYTVKNIHPGDKVSIAIKAVEDWAIYDAEDQIVAGAFSEKYLKSKQR